MSVNLNNSAEYVKELKIFNDGKADVVENVKVRIEKKSASDTDDKKPVYKLIAADGKGEVNEGFYYQEDESDAFKKYQAQRLIMLAKGVLGEKVQFPVFNTAKETLDGVMNMVAPELNKRPYRVAVCYGTTKRPSSFLGFKSFGSFIQPMAEPNTLALSSSDSTVRKPTPPATSEKALIETMDTANGTGEKLAWME